MKFLQVITSLGAGGAENILAVLASLYLDAGHSVSVISLLPRPENPAIPDRLERLHVPVRYLNFGKWSPFSNVFCLRRAIREIAPDVVHSHLIHPNLLCRIAMTGLGIPLVNTIHISERRPGKKPFFLLDRLTYRMADACTAVSRASALFHAHACGIPPSAIRTVYNGVGAVPAPSEERKAEVNSLWHREKYTKVLGTIGRLDWQKGYDLLLERLEAVSGRIPSGENRLFVFIGEGPERAKLEELAKRHKTENIDVLFFGFQKDAASLISLFDVFLIPSRYEGYGLALAEAMTFGIPIVASNADSLPELCELYGGAYRLVDMARDVSGEELAEAVFTMSEAERTEGTVLQTPERMAQEYLSIYEEIALKRDGRA